MKGRVVCSPQIFKRTSTAFSCKDMHTLRARRSCARWPSKEFRTAFKETYSYTDLSKAAVLLQCLPPPQAASTVTSSSYSNCLVYSRPVLNGLVSGSKGQVVAMPLSIAKDWYAALRRFGPLCSQGGPFFGNGRAACFASSSTQSLTRS